MLFDVQNDIKIAGRPAVNASLAHTRETNPGAVFDSSWNFGIDRPLLDCAAFAFAFGAGIANDASGALARSTTPSNTEKALLISDLASASAGPATYRWFAVRA